MKSSLLLAVLVLGQAEARSVATPQTSLNANSAKKALVTAKAEPAKPVAVPVPAKAVPEVPASKAKAVAKVADPSKTAVASLIKQPISPPLKDVQSDKKFFGSNGDYGQDSRPAPDKSIMDKLKGGSNIPYPALQSKSHFDEDYVKDENSDTGAWKAQFEYDALRKKLAKEQGDIGGAEDRANKEKADEDAAQKKADEAAKNAADAQKGVDEENKEHQGGPDDDEGQLLPPSEANLEKLKKQVAEAEASFEKEKKDFEQCQKQLDEAKKLVEELKAKQAEMEKQLASETKLWSETKSVRLNLKKAKEESARTKRTAAEARLKVAQNTKADLDQVLAKEKAESDLAHSKLQKEKAELEQFKKDLAAATLRLQKLRGYTPAEPLKSNARMAGLSFLALLAVQALM
jgi:hypothetical protein